MTARPPLASAIAGVDEGEQRDAEDQQALGGVDQRLEEQVAERVALVVGAGDQGGDPQRQQRRHEEAEVEEAVEQDRARAGGRRTRDRDGAEQSAAAAESSSAARSETHRPQPAIISAWLTITWAWRIEARSISRPL